MPHPALRLYTFAISHFSEKARWGLSFAGLPFVETQLLPGLHALTTRRLAASSSVPILVHDGRAIQGSSAILDYAADRLGATSLRHTEGLTSESQSLEALFDYAFGLGIQRIGYQALLQDRATTTRLWSQGSPRLGRLFYALAYPGVARAVRAGYVKGPDAVARAKDRFRDAMDQCDAALATNPCLLGDEVTRVDLSLAALLAPLCCPPEHLVAWPPHSDSLRPFVEEFAGRPTWNHVLRLYRDYRHTARVPAS